MRSYTIYHFKYRTYELNAGNTDIHALIAGCRSNDRASQKELYNLLRDYAVKICYRYQNNLEQVEEIMNEGFIKLFKNVHQFEESRHADMLASLKGWFKRILVNTCIDHYRKNASYINGQLLTEDAENIADKQETGIDILSYKEIIEAIRQLSPAYRTVFNLFVIEGLSHDEIARHLGISVGSSKSQSLKSQRKPHEKSS